MRRIWTGSIPIALWAVAALSAGVLMAYVVMQQAERLGANDPQVQMAEDATSALQLGRPVEGMVAGGTIDIARSLAPFVIVLDDAGRPVGASGMLDGRVPVPPAGVLDDVRTRGEARLTWAPHRDIRLASVVRRVTGSRPGFVIAARSLREVERRIGVISRLLVLGWLCGMVLSFLIYAGSAAAASAGLIGQKA